MAKTVTIRIDDSTYRRIKSAAEAERRTISNFIEYATMAYVENSSFVDDDEMKGISEDHELLATLGKAMEEIRKGQYRVVR
ncbi:MAG TPA: CopG family transcriptional regulator [Spirochaetia bacterium]|nr:CopG family transcriptional regulator [Spirochaetia bacterium]